MAQKEDHSFELVLRTAADPNGMAVEVRSALKQINSRLPILEQQTLDKQIEHALQPQMMMTDPWALSASILLIAAVSLFAGYLPANRAAKIDPMLALRHEQFDAVYFETAGNLGW